MKVNLLGTIILVVFALTGCRKETVWHGVPILPDASIQIEQKWQLVYTTNQSPDDVSAFYRIEMEQNGWVNETARTVLENNREITITNYSRNGYKTEVAVSEDGGNTFVSIMIISTP